LVPLSEPLVVVRNGDAEPFALGRDIGLVIGVDGITRVEPHQPLRTDAGHRATIDPAYADGSDQPSATWDDVLFFLTDSAKYLLLFVK
jgi:hypothetical protein